MNPAHMYSMWPGGGGGGVVGSGANGQRSMNGGGGGGSASPFPSAGVGVGVGVGVGSMVSNYANSTNSRLQAVMNAAAAGHPYNMSAAAAAGNTPHFIPSRFIPPMIEKQKKLIGRKIN